MPGDELAFARRGARPLHVLKLSDVYFPRINGVSTSIQTFRGDLARQGVRVTVVAPQYPGADSESDMVADIVRLPSRAVPLDPEDRLMRWSFLADLDRLLAGADFDLVHVQTPFAAHYAGLRLARAREIPCSATYHTHFEEYLAHYIRFLPQAALRFAARWLARHQCNALDAIVVPSQPMAATLRDYGIGAPLHVIPTGLPESQFRRGDGKRFRQNWGIAPERKVALFVGRAAFEKNIGFLLQMMAWACQQRPEMMLVIAGEGPALSALRRQASALRLDENVRFVGYLPREGSLRDCYAAADVFTFASLTETQGLVLLEAMAVGLPVVALAHMGTVDILAPRRGCLVPDDEPAAFADTVLDLLSDAALRGRLAAEARAFAHEWSDAAMGRRLAALYRDYRQ